jgi:DNA repair protein RadA/Sms
VQALTIETGAPNPRRIVNGVDAARVAMVLAVLEKRARIKTSNLDVYVSTVGGVRFTEPAADLAIAIAVAGSILNEATPKKLAAIGELSLAGEIRPVTQTAQRRSEAARLGYTDLIDNRSGSVRGALNDVRARAKGGRGEDIPEF